MGRPQLGIFSANQLTWPCWLAPQGRALLLMHFHLKTKQDQKKSKTKQNPSKDSTKPHTTASFQWLHHFSFSISLSPASQGDTSASSKHQHDTSDTPAAMQALRSNPLQNCTQFPGDWECTGFEERDPLISPGSFSHTAHRALLTSALPYFVLQL